MSKYAIGVDFGTESGRAVLIDVADGRQVATAENQPNVRPQARRRARTGQGP